VKGAFDQQAAMAEFAAENPDLTEYLMMNHIDGFGNGSLPDADICDLFEWTSTDGSSMTLVGTPSTGSSGSTDSSGSTGSSGSTPSTLSTLSTGSTISTPSTPSTPSTLTTGA